MLLRRRKIGKRASKIGQLARKDREDFDDPAAYAGTTLN
jgi:hypothetical protein